MSEEIGCKHNTQVAGRHEVVLHVFRTAHSGGNTNTYDSCTVAHVHVHVMYMQLFTFYCIHVAKGLIDAKCFPGPEVFN